MKKFNKLFLIFCLSIMLLFSALPAIAADEASSTVEDTTNTDLFNTLFYVSYYSLYDLNDSIHDAKDVESLIAAVAETDKWARYYDPESYAAYIESLEGEKCGIGIYYLLENGAVNVSGLVPGAAAEKSGVQVGDRIIIVDGKIIAEMSDVEVTAAFAGEEGTVVTITLLRGDEEIEMSLVRAPFTLESVAWKMLEDNIAYVSIAHFTEQTGDELMIAFFQMMAQGAEGMILDLRDCPGGTMNGAVDVISLLTDADPALMLEYKSSFSIYPRSLSNMIDLPMVTLVNEQSASASELVAGTLQDRKRSVVIGTQTFGKGLMQNIFSLPSGAGFAITTAKYRTIGWQDVDEQGGIFPDIYVSDYAAQTARAIEILKLQNKFGNTLVFHYGSTEVRYNSGTLNFQNAPIVKNGVSYLPLRETLMALGYEVFWQNGLTYISTGMEKIIFDTERLCATENKLTYPVDSFISNGSTYVSSDFWRNFVDCQLVWNDIDKSLTLTKPVQK